MKNQHRSFQRQYIGQRSGQEDRCLILSTEKKGYQISTIAVADGMGGHAAGEVAAGLAIKAIKKLHQRLSTENKPVWNVIRSELKSAILQANKDVLDTVKKDPTKSGMGTTLTCAVIVNDEAVIGHIGDSRAYLLDSSGINQVTIDHTALQDAIDRGMNISGEGVGLNALLHCIDGTEELRIDIYPVQNESSCFSVKEHVLLLCSDGLYGTIGNEGILQALSETDSVENFGNKLIDESKSRKSNDNVSIVTFAPGSFDFNFGNKLKAKIEDSVRSRISKALFAFTLLLASALIFALLEETNTINTGYLDYLKTDESLTHTKEADDESQLITLISPSIDKGLVHPDSIQFIWSHSRINNLSIHCFELNVEGELRTEQERFSVSDTLFTHTTSDSIATLTPRESLFKKNSRYRWNIFISDSAHSDICKDIRNEPIEDYEFKTINN